VGEIGKKKSGKGFEAIALVDRSYMYYLKGQPWVPHYTEKGVFVAPGGFEKRESELAVLGAVKKEAYLWPRFWMNEKSRMVK